MTTTTKLSHFAYRLHLFTLNVSPGYHKKWSSSIMSNQARKPWVDGPFHLIETPAKKYGVKDQSVYSANGMALIHNTYIRALNSIYLQCKGLNPSTHSPKDISDFLFYCQTWACHVQRHHDIEEEYFFPGIEKLAGQKDLLDGERDQHEAFRDGFLEFTTYVQDTAPEKYDGSKVQSLIDSFGSKLELHMHDEIASLLEIGKRYDPDGSKIKKLSHEFAARGRSEGSMAVDLAFLLSAQDRTFEGGIQQFPPVPFFVPYMTSFVAHRGEHAGIWRFAGSNIFGEPRELEFLPTGHTP